MNRHGISQNPTAEESALLRQLWRGDDARNRAANAVAEAADWERRALAAERRSAILEAEIVRLAG